MSDQDQDPQLVVNDQNQPENNEEDLDVDEDTQLLPRQQQEEEKVENNNDDGQSDAESEFKEDFDEDIMPTIKTNFIIVAIFIVIILCIRFVIPPKEGVDFDRENTPVLFKQKIRQFDHKEILEQIQLSSSKNHDLQIRPLLDPKNYRFFSLKNGIQALIIQDDQAKSAAHLCQVKSGYYSDPDYLPGLAHYTEHMVLKGSESTNTSLKVFVSQYNGMNNGFTMAESTNYLYWIPNEFLKKSVEFTADMVIDPLIDQTLFDKEINAVNNEHEKNLQEMFRRIYTYAKFLAAENQPFHKFATGNLLTLRDRPLDEGISTRDEMKKFINQHHYGQNVNVVLLGNYELDEMQTWIEDNYSQMKKDPPPEEDQVSQILGPAFGPQEKGNIVYLQPVIPENKRLYMMFFIEDPELVNDEETGVFQYIFNFIDRETKGLLYDHLYNEKEYVTNIQQFYSKHSKNLVYVCISFQLTDLGFENSDEILRITFDYFQFLKENIVNEQTYHQEGFQQFMKFNFYGQKDAWDSIMDLAYRFDNLDKSQTQKNLLSYETFFYKYDEAKMRKIFDEILQPNQANYFLASQDFQIPGDENEISEEGQNQSEPETISPPVVDEFLQLQKQNILLKQDEEIFLTQSLEYDEKYRFLIRKIPSDELDKLKSDFSENDEFHLDQKITKSFFVENLRSEILEQTGENIESLQLISSECDIQVKDDQEETFNEKLERYYQSLCEDKVDAELFQQLQESYENECIKAEIHQDSLSNEPSLIYESPSLNLYHKLDRSLKQPAIYMTMKFAFPDQDPETGYPSVFFKLASQILQNDLVYRMPYKNGLQSSGIGQKYSSVKLQIYGLQDGFLDYAILAVDTVSKQMGRDHSENQFSIAKKQVEKMLIEQAGTQPFNFAIQIFKQFMHKTMDPTFDQQLEILSEIEFEEFSDFWNDLIVKKNAKIFSYVTGNINDNDSMVLTKALVKQFESQNEKESEISNSELSEDEIVIEDQSLVLRLLNQNQEELNSVIINYYETGLRTPQNQAYITLMQQVMKTQAYEFLRTEHQLGYTTAAQSMIGKDSVGFIVIVQGSKLPPHEMDILIEEFLGIFANYMTSMSEQEFEDLKSGTVNTLEVKEVSLSQRGSNVWDKIVTTQDYDINDEMVEVIKNLTQQELMEFYEKYLKDDGSKLSIQLYDQSYGDELPTDLLTEDQIYSSRLPEMIENSGDFYFLKKSKL